MRVRVRAEERLNRRLTPILPYSGYFSRGNIFVVFVVERRTTKYLHTKKRKPRARAQNHKIFSTK